MFQLTAGVGASVHAITPTWAMVDFDEASVSAFQHVFPEAAAAGCWFHYAQSLIKHLNKFGLKEAYGRDADVTSN